MRRAGPFLRLRSKLRRTAVALAQAVGPAAMPATKLAAIVPEPAPIRECYFDGKLNCRIDIGPPRLDAILVRQH